MADAKISALTNYTTPLDADVLPIVDTANGITKKITYPNLMATPNTRATYTVGVLDNALVKTYFNIQLPFILWTGGQFNSTSTDFENWARSSDSTVYVSGSGSSVDFISTGQARMYTQSFFRIGNSISLRFNNTRIVILDWWAKLPASGTGDINMGFIDSISALYGLYNDSSYNRVMFNQKATGELYATISKTSVGVTNTDISSGLTLTNWNNYRIEYDISNEVRFYVNGVLKATLSGVNLPSSSNDISIGFGRNDTSLFQVTAPTLSLQMNP